MNKAELIKTLKERNKWLEGRESDFANLLSDGLIYLNLNNVCLRDADLSGADLRGINLSNADLVGANLSRANLSGADLRATNLIGANLIGANLSGADLKSANLSGANLMGADLRGSRLSGANLMNADLSDAKSNEYTSGYHLVCPEAGSFTAYKKADGVIVTLLIPEDAKRSSATSRKCRADKAIVLDIDNGLDEVASSYDSQFIYRKGSIVSVDNFNEDRWIECSTGIHFFITRKEAEDY